MCLLQQPTTGSPSDALAHASGGGAKQFAAGGLKTGRQADPDYKQKQHQQSKEPGALLLLQACRAHADSKHAPCMLWI